MSEALFLEEDKPLKASERPLSGMRKVIAQRMCDSYFTNPVVTLTTEIDMTESEKFRKNWNDKNAESCGKLSYLDMIICAAAHALHNHPTMNASLTENKIHFLDYVNVGFAVDMNGKGLVVPVVRDADKKDMPTLVKTRKELVDKCLAGKASMDDITGGTFTVTNLGSYGIDVFTPIINMPECAILGVGRIVKKPVAVDGEIVIRSRMVLSLTHDHRLNDGGPAAKFLQEVASRLENPMWMEKQ